MQTASFSLAEMRKRPRWPLALFASAGNRSGRGSGRRAIATVVLGVVAAALAACQSATPLASGTPTTSTAGTGERPGPGATVAEQPPALAASSPSPTSPAASSSGEAAPAPPPAAPPPTRPPRIGLALGGGAARGFAHIGAIQVLEEAGIRPDLVVGTSAGSLVAALYASGRGAQDLAATALTLDEGTISDWTFPGRGVIRGEALARFVREKTGGRTIEQMRLPLGIVATDLDSGAPVLFRRGDTGTAVRASSAVPAVFQPVRIGAREYVDGGLVSPVPVPQAREMGAEFVIAIDISTPPEGAPTGDALQMLLQTFTIMSRSISRHELKDADFVLRPSLIGVSSADFNGRVRAIRAGREAAAQALPELKARLAAAAR